MVVTRLVRLIYEVYPAVPVFPEYRLARRLAEAYGCRRVLDVGCGRGNLFRILEDLIEEYVGIDISGGFPIKSHKTRFIIHDARKPILLDGRFNCVFFVNSINYIGVESLMNFRNVADVIIIIDIDPRYPHVKILGFLERLRRYRLEELEEHVKRLGFRVVERCSGSTYALVMSC